MLLDDHFRGALDALRLVAVEARRADVLLEDLEVGLGEVLRAAVLFEELRRHNVHPVISALGGEDRRHQELQRIVMDERALRVAIDAGERVDDFLQPLRR